MAAAAVERLKPAKQVQLELALEVQVQVYLQVDPSHFEFQHAGKISKLKLKKENEINLIPCCGTWRVPVAVARPGGPWGGAQGLQGHCLSTCQSSDLKVTASLTWSYHQVLMYSFVAAVRQ